MLRVHFSNQDLNQPELDFREEIQKIAEHNAKILLDSYYSTQEKIDKKKKSKEKQENYAKTLNISNSSPNKILSVKERISNYENEIQKLEEEKKLDENLISICIKHYRVNHKLDLYIDYEKNEYKSKFI